MKNKQTTGFTLLETIVAVTVLVTAIIGPFSLASQTIKAQSIAKNQLIAANLAQEGIELFRNYRANNILRNATDSDGGFSHWLDGTDACQSGCGIDVRTDINAPQPAPELPGCGTLNNCLLYLNGDSMYGLNPAGTPTKFHRKINIETVSAVPPEIKVTTTVTWSEGVGTDTFVVSTDLLNW